MRQSIGCAQADNNTSRKVNENVGKHKGESKVKDEAKTNAKLSNSKWKAKQIKVKDSD